MKTCPYCGREYPDDISVCAVNQTPLEPEVSENIPPVISMPDKTGALQRVIIIIFTIIAVLAADFVLPFACGYWGLRSFLYSLCILVLLLAPFLAGAMVIVFLRNVPWSARIVIGILACAVLLGPIL